MLFLGRILTGISSATFATANALIADVSPAEERAQNFGLTGLAFGLGFIFGPAIGGFVGEWDTRAPFFLAATLAFLNSIYGFIVLKETLRPSLRRPFELARALPWQALMQIGKFPMLIGLIMVMFIYNLGHHVYPSNWHFYTMEKFDWTPLDIGLSMGLVGILMAFVQGYLIRIVIPKLGAPKTALIGLAAGATTFIGIAFAPTPMVLYMWMFMSAIAGFVGPSVNGIMSNAVPQNQQGELQGILASVGSIGAIIGPLLLTQSFTFFTNDSAPIYFPGAAFFIAGSLSLIAVALFAKNVRNLITDTAKDTQTT